LDCFEDFFQIMKFFEEAKFFHLGIKLKANMNLLFCNITLDFKTFDDFKREFTNRYFYPELTQLAINKFKNTNYTGITAEFIKSF
jgi:hypothetical protein